LNGTAIRAAVSGTDGVVIFDGLKPGSYSIKETKAPNGYNIYSEPLAFKIDSKGTQLEFTLRNTLVSDNGSGVLGWSEVNNNTGGGELPFTGGYSGTFFALLAGLIILLFGLIIAPNKRKRKRR